MKKKNGTSDFIKHLSAATKSMDRHFKGSTIEDLKSEGLTPKRVAILMAYYTEMYAKLKAQSVSGRIIKKN